MSLSTTVNNNKIINGWAFYDWANSAYFLVISTAIFPNYFISNTEAYIKFFGFEIANSAFYSFLISIAYIIIAISTPILSGVADYSGNRKNFLKIFTTFGSIGCIALFWFVDSATMWVGIIAFVVATVGYADAYARAHQVPLQINYHKNIRNWQLVGFTGISLNILQLEIPRFEVDIYANEELVSNDINFSPLEETVFIPNIIFGAGIRYRFYNRYNANIFYNHNPLNTSFARLQFGLTYSI